ncbi:hypothetical protein BASA81_006792 [Batrachochytrium salamandrivorans]|nr:hypothetical protein BASA81_006792 [Batrachochytrium salamandrivorans]
MHRVALVADYFFPGLGGVEMHIWNLAQELIKLGHHVIVITHATKDRVGIRIMTRFLKVYYLPFPLFLAGNPFPGIFHSLPLLREIFLRERIGIVHGHQSTSAIAHEAMFHGKLLGLRTVFTEHSLYEFGEMGSANLNKLLKFTLSTCDFCVGVSECCRENLVLRAGIRDPDRAITIRNAVDPDRFRPRPEMAPERPRVNIIVVSRLAYRKGVDLVARVVPRVCERHPHVNFIIGGDGPKRVLLDEMVERHALHSRVELVGEVRNVGEVLVRGSIFLNCSLTESFCIAILEAACAGLAVVSTKVGGVPEVLPSHMIYFPLDGEEVVQGLVSAVDRALQAEPVDAFANHQEIRDLYSWKSVAEQTCARVYDKLDQKPSAGFVDLLLAQSGDPVAGVFAAWALALDWLLLMALQWLVPRVELAL